MDITQRYDTARLPTLREVVPRRSIFLVECPACALQPLCPQRQKALGVVLDAAHEAMAYELKASRLDGPEDALLEYRDSTWESPQTTMDNEQRKHPSGVHKLGVFGILFT